MVLNISDNAKKKDVKTGMSQQQLINTLLSERQPVNNASANNIQQPQPPKEWV